MERGEPLAKALWQDRKFPFPEHGFLVNVHGDLKLHLQFYQFQTDSRQSLSGYVPACLARARRMAREAAITFPD